MIARRRTRVDPELPPSHERSQYLPIPLGSLSPAHRRSPLWLRWRRYRELVYLATGFATLVVAVLIGSATPSVAVYGDASGVHLGRALLTLQPTSPIAGYSAYTGAGSMLIARWPGGARATAAAVLGGQQVRGRCDATVTQHSSDLAQEACVFETDGGRLTSHDTFDPSARIWTRTYSDGESMLFVVPPGTVAEPIPLPFGHS